MRSDTRRRSMLAVLSWTLVVVVFAAACQTINTGAREAQDEISARIGKQLIEDYGCGSCHTIPGVRGADGLVAPPLTHFSQRAYIAGSLVNNPENLARWIANPQEVEEGTAMPDLGVSDEEAANIAAYLETLD